MRRFLAIVGLLLTFGLPASTGAAREAEGTDDSWMQQYYQHPQPERFEAEVKKLQKTEALQTVDALPPMAAFFSRLFQAATPDQLARWLTFIHTLSPADQRVFLAALRWADTPETLDALRAIATEQKGKSEDAREVLDAKVPDIGKISGTDPGELDMCWGAFFATGDAKYVFPVIRCAVLPVVLNAVNPTREAARWSLKALCAVHPRVREIKDQFYSTAPPAEQASLDELFKK